MKPAAERFRDYLTNERNASPHTVDEALESLAIPPDGVLDGGPIPPDSAASTVIKIERSGAWSILRLHNHDLGTYIILGSMVFKFIEVTLRLMKI